MMVLKLESVDEETGERVTYGEMEIRDATMLNSKKDHSDFKVKLSAMGTLEGDTKAKRQIEADVKDFDRLRWGVEFGPWVVVFGALQGIIGNIFQPHGPSREPHRLAKR